MSLLAVWSDGYLAHDARWLVWAGIRFDGDEEAVRAEILRSELEQAGVSMVPAMQHDRAELKHVHDPAMIDYLETAYERWVEAGYLAEHGADRVIPYAFRHPSAFGAYPTREPKSRVAMAGVYCMDTTTTIGPGTYRGARAAADGALTAAALVAQGELAVYAPVRPPGHHAGTDYFGGSCYLNNVAIASDWLTRRDAGPVAIIDIDAHHGNGTQQIFYERGDVLYTSIHVDPGAGWFPHWCGFAGESGFGEGLGANLNVPQAPGSGDDAFLAALDEVSAAVVAHEPRYLVVSLGVDAGASDPESPLRVTNEGFAAIGERIAALGLPTVLIQEGGYHLEALGPDVMAVLTAFR
ncbi:MAG: histone deacetylase family protein [Acidimicrobiia bacterium]